MLISMRIKQNNITLFNIVVQRLLIELKNHILTIFIDTLFCFLDLHYQNIREYKRIPTFSCNYIIVVTPMQISQLSVT